MAASYYSRALIELDKADTDTVHVSLAAYADILNPCLSLEGRIRRLK